jgi:hypothetical protein
MGVVGFVISLDPFGCDAPASAVPVIVRLFVTLGGAAAVVERAGSGAEQWSS